MANFCSEPSCTGLAVKGKFCPLHIANNYQQRRVRPERDSWYSRSAWRVYVRPTKLRHDPMCAIEGCGKLATDVHHLDGSWKTTGDWRLFIDQNNLESLCHAHHSEITLKEQRNG
jgi:5-methylcytosine-specific restriction enzyme A